MNWKIWKGAKLILEYGIISVFIYAAVTKIIAPFEFQVKLLKSSYLPVAAVPVISWILPLGEGTAVALMLFKESARLGWMLIYTLMIFFNGHLLILHEIAPAAPCSCGGLLESISLTEHLIMNLLITIFAAYKLIESG